MPKVTKAAGGRAMACLETLRAWPVLVNLPHLHKQMGAWRLETYLALQCSKIFRTFYSMPLLLLFGFSQQVLTGMNRSDVRPGCQPC